MLDTAGVTPVGSPTMIIPIVPLRSGTRVGPALTIERTIGAGGMGTVYLAYDDELDRRVALKVLRSTELQESAGRTLLEARAAARVVHPHVVAVHGLGDHGGVPYIVMEFVDGPSLRACIAQRTLPDRSGRMTWIAQLAAALQCAHELGVMHCDVKPENVLIRSSGAAGGLAKLVDFGLARSRRDATDQMPLSQGTLAYLAPELLDGPPTPAADQFSLAIVACELLARRPERPDVRGAVALAHDGTLPPAAWAALARGVHKDPVQRFGSVSAFADALLRGLGLALARGPLVGTSLPVLDRDSTWTSSEMPVPALGLVFDGVDPQHLILATLALLPTGYPGALREALGATPPPDALAALEASGKVVGRHDEWRLADGVDREDVRNSLSSRHHRHVSARAAWAVENVGPKRESVREDATRLYLAARRLTDAARLAAESAEAAHSARERDHHYGRAVAFLTNASRPVPWLGALLQRCEWASQCGWLHLARGPLSEAQGVLAEAGLPRDHLLHLRTALATAVVREMHGDVRAALAQLDVWTSQSLPAVAEDTHVLLAHARRVEVLTRSNHSSDALAHAHAVFERLGPGARVLAQDAGMKAFGLLHLAVGNAERAAGRLARAESAVQRSLAIQQERGDVIQTANARVARANLAAVQKDYPRAEQGYLLAAELVAPLGGIALAGVIEANLGDCRLRTGRPWDALRGLLRAQVLFEEIGTSVYLPGVLRSLADTWEALGQVDAAAGDRARAAQLDARGRAHV
ncbi:MAG: serine/threonine protein kinase [Myxococcales bacterium]|nr:serine/threonine protein kinase [Myxococcales bacterium]